MIFSWLRKRRRRKLLATSFPDDWHAILKRNVEHYAQLDDTEQSKLRDDLRVLIAEKTWTGIGDLVVTDEMKVTVAAQASLLLLNIEHDYFPQTDEIILHPTNYRALQDHYRASGIVDGPPEVLGQAYYRGPVVLSWASALAGGRNEDDGRNLVLHEFAHKLDMADDLSDGTPQLNHRDQYKQWVDVMSREFNELRDRTERRKATLLDKYGSTNEAEFFACATECFFEKPKKMREKHPELYGVLQDYFGQDPEARES